MGRKRKHNKHLPRSMQFKHGAYYFLTAQEEGVRWMRLSNEYGEALRRYADLVGSTHRVQTVSEAITHYIAISANNLSDDTIKGYRQSVRRIAPIFGEMPIADLRRDHVYRYLTERGNVAANRDRALLSATYTHLLNVGLFQGTNPCAGLRYRNPERPRRRYITDDEFEKLTNTLPRPLSLMARFSYLTGMRESDMLGLELTAGSDAGIEYTPSKRRKHQEPRPILIEWSDELRDVWRAAVGARIGSQPLFPTRAGTHYSRDSFQSLWQRWRKKVGISDLRWHDIRRKTGSDSLTTSEASDRLAHADETVTRKHYRAKPRTVKPLK